MRAMSEPPVPQDLGELLELIDRWCCKNLRRRPVEVGFRWGNGRRPTWWPMPECPPGVGTGPAAQGPAEQVFVPTPFQNAILDALEGKALRTDALGAAAGDRGRLFRHPGGLRELREQGLVSHHERRGFFRPDAPPEELA
jgi:hypothetical protein